MHYRYYEGTPTIINLSLKIGRLLGFIDAGHLRKPKATLRKANRIKTIQSSLAIEGNSLSLEEVATGAVLICPLTEKFKSIDYQCFTHIKKLNYLCFARKFDIKIPSKNKR